MKKFSNIAKVETPKDNKILEVKEIVDVKYDIYKLIENFLRVVVNGAVNPVILSSIGIEGQEMFTEALIEYFKLKETKDQIKLLESARNSFVSNDYEWVEKRIIQLGDKLDEKQTASMLTKHKMRVRDILINSDYNLSKSITLAERQCSKIKDGEKAYYRGITAEQMSTEEPEYKKILIEISKIFLFKSKQLGYTK